MNKQTIILLLIFGLLLIPVGNTLKTYALEKYTRLSNEGLTAYCVAYLDTQKTAPETPPTPKPTQTSCDACKGTKRVLSGDKLVSLPCPCGKNCKCQPMRSEPEVQVERKRYILLVTATQKDGKKSWCKWCNVVEDNVIPALKSTNWEFGKGKHIQVVDFDTDKDTVEKYKIEQVPTWLLIDDGQVINRYDGFLNGWGVGTFWDKKPLTSDDTKEILSTKSAKDKKN